MLQPYGTHRSPGHRLKAARTWLIMTVHAWVQVHGSTRLNLGLLNQMCICSCSGMLQHLE